MPETSLRLGVQAFFWHAGQVLSLRPILDAFGWRARTALVFGGVYLLAGLLRHSTLGVGAHPSYAATVSLALNAVSLLGMAAVARRALHCRHAWYVSTLFFCALLVSASVDLATVLAAMIDARAGAAPGVLELGLDVLLALRLAQQDYGYGSGR